MNSEKIKDNREPLEIFTKIIINSLWVDYEYKKLFGYDKNVIIGIKVEEMISYIHRHNFTENANISQYQRFYQILKIHESNKTYGYRPEGYESEYLPISFDERKKIWYASREKSLSMLKAIQTSEKKRKETL